MSIADSSVMVNGRRACHRIETADLLISNGDESEFLSRIKEDVRLQVERSGGKVSGEGSGDGGYCIEYVDGQVNGWIDLVGMRGSGDSYRMVIIVSEN